MSKATRKLILNQVQAQMEQAVDCCNEEAFSAARIHFTECANLCQQAELDQALKPLPSEKQITLDIKP